MIVAFPGHTHLLFVVRYLMKTMIDSSGMFVCFVALRPSQQLWTWREGQFT